LKIELKWFIYEFLCSWKYKEIIFFIKIKFIIGVWKTVVHSCLCIYVIEMCGLSKIQLIQNVLKWCENSFRIKGKKGKKKQVCYLPRPGSPARRNRPPGCPPTAQDQAQQRTTLSLLTRGLGPASKRSPACPAPSLLPFWKVQI